MVKIINLDGTDEDSISTIVETETTIDLTGTPLPTTESYESVFNLDGVPIPARIDLLSGLSDVDTTGVENYSLLLYNAVAETWYPSRYLGNHTFDAGQY